MPTSSNSRGQHATSSYISPIPHIFAKDPTPATAHPNYWYALVSDSDNDAEFRSDIDLNRAHEANITPKATEGEGI